MQFLQALRREDLLAPNEEPDMPTLARAVHAFVARTPSIVAMAQIDDLSDEADPVNIPATSESIRIGDAGWVTIVSDCFAGLDKSLAAR